MRGSCHWHFEGWPCGTFLGRIWGSGVSLGNFVCFQIPLGFLFPIHCFCLSLRQWHIFSRKQEHRTTVLIDLTLDGHCHEGQPHLPSHTEHPRSRLSQMFHCSAFFSDRTNCSIRIPGKLLWSSKITINPHPPPPSSETDHTM